MHIFPPIYFLSVLIITIHSSIMKKYFYLYRIQHTGVDQHYYAVQKFKKIRSSISKCWPFNYNIGLQTAEINFEAENYHNIGYVLTIFSFKITVVGSMFWLSKVFISLLLLYAYFKVKKLLSWLHYSVNF